jgi:hypothetical protein
VPEKTRTISMSLADDNIQLWLVTVVLFLATPPRSTCSTTILYLFVDLLPTNALTRESASSGTTHIFCLDRGS